MIKHSLAIWFILLFTAGTLLGCGGELAAVRGTVEREGNKLAAGKVVFTPIGGGRTAFGEIQSDGSFQLTSERPNDGVLPGKYRVRVIETESSELGALRTNHLAPPDHVIEVSRDGSNDLAILIRRENGWQSKQDN